MRVIWICLDWPSSTSHSGGVGRYVSRLAARMRDLVDLTIVTHMDADDLDGVTMVKVPISGSRLDRFYRAPFRVNWAVKQIPADLIHAHGDDWALRTSVPVIRTFHGSSWSEARTSGGLRRYNHVILGALEHLSAWKAAKKIAIAPESARAFRCDTIMPPLGDVPPALERRPSDKPSVIFIGLYHGRKRGYLVQDAVAYASRELGRDVRLIVVGPANDAVNWGPTVEHFSGLSDREVREKVASAWALMAPSSYEGFGIPTVEGLAMGVPVVSSPNPGTNFISGLADCHLPLLVVGNEERLGDALLGRLQAGPHLSEEEAHSAARWCEQLYGMAAPERLKAIYDEVITSAR